MLTIERKIFLTLGDLSVFALEFNSVLSQLFKGRLCSNFKIVTKFHIIKILCTNFERNEV